jgi:glycosyltransferase involved in cell wall biosynthesis
VRILIIHQYFLGAQDAGGSRFNQFARYWSEAGHQVTVLAGTVHYATGRKAPAYKGHFLVRETAPGGVRVVRCHVSEQYNVSFLGRAWAYLSFTASSLWAGLTAVPRPDVVVATSPPLTVGLTALALRVLTGAPYVFEVRDLWPESAIDAGVITHPLMKAAGLAMEWLAYRGACRINALTPAFEEILATRKGVPRERLSMIPNGADLDLLAPGPKENRVRRDLGLQGKFVVTYVGAHGVANRLMQLVEAAERLRDDPQVVLLLVGDGMEKPRLRQEAARRGLRNVRFVDSVPKREIGEYINASDVCTAVLQANDTFRTVYPNKLFDYMTCARPIIVGIDGVARRLVEEAGAGLFAEPENPDAMVRCIRRLQADRAACEAMGQAGRRFVEQHYDRRMLARRYERVLEGVVSGRRRPRGPADDGQRRGE